MNIKPLYITLEGPDLSGKSTLLEKLKEFLTEKDVSFKVVSMLPEGPIREMVLRDQSLTPMQRMALIRVAADSVYREVDAALAEGCFVLSDRGVDSFYAYQKYGYELMAAERLDQMFDLYGQKKVLPDLTFFLNAPIEVCQVRMALRGDAPDLIESQSTGFMRRVRDGYLTRMHQDPDRFYELDAAQHPILVAERAKLRLSWHLGD